MLEFAISDLIPYAKCLDTLDMCECYNDLFYLWSRYWLNVDEVLLLSASLNTRIRDLCPS